MWVRLVHLVRVIARAIIFFVTFKTDLSPCSQSLLSWKEKATRVPLLCFWKTDFIKGVFSYRTVISKAVTFQTGHTEWAFCSDASGKENGLISSVSRWCFRIFGADIQFLDLRFQSASDRKRRSLFFYSYRKQQIPFELAYLKKLLWLPLQINRYSHFKPSLLDGFLFYRIWFEVSFPYSMDSFFKKRFSWPVNFIERFVLRFSSTSKCFSRCLLIFIVSAKRAFQIWRFDCP